MICYDQFNINERKAINVIEVDKETPLPSAKAIYPYAKMEVGDSFLATCRCNPISIAKRWGKPRGIDFTSRKEDGGWRLWRTK